MERIVGRVINGVNLLRLRVTRGTGEGEIRVTTRVPQDLQFVIDPTTASVAARVVQGPVAMNEAVPNAATPIRREQAMAAQFPLEVLDCGAEMFCGVVVVMQV